MPASSAKAIQKDVIHNAAVKPFRRAEISGIDQQTEFVFRVVRKPKIHVVDAIGKERFKAAQKQKLIEKQPVISVLAKRTCGKRERVDVAGSLA